MPLDPVVQETLVALQKALGILTTLAAEGALTAMEKGWLPAGTSQNDLPDAAFLWIADAYKSGKSKDKAAGRKFPVKGPDGKVDPHGWIAAWDILHGGMGGGDFGGGPSKDEVLQRLLACKPSAITLQDGHASIKKADDLDEATAALASALAEEGLLLAGEERAQYVRRTEDAAIAKAYIPIEKADPELGIIFGKASVADIFDHEGHRIRPAQLERAAYAFMEKAHKRATNTHGATIPGTFVASWVMDGVWLVGFKPEDKRIAKAAANGDFVGFSIGGFGRLVPAQD